MTDTPTLPLADARIPVVGLGTYGLFREQGVEQVVTAVRAGYRLLDTAQGYGNEAEVAAGMRDSGVPRDEFLLTTKLPNGDHGFDETLASFDRSQAALRVDVVDLYLIHWPMPEVDRYVESWKAMIRLRDEGRIRAIGVSNFSAEQIDRLERETGELPALNQVELHVGLDQADLRRYHDAKGVLTESYSPLKHGSALAKDPVVTRVAEAHGVAWNQVVLRWNLQLGTVVIPRSTDAERQASNLAVTGFELTDDEMTAIGGLHP
ncbi:aldo/keto reductase [Amnibacterium sp.]|uniref:aldo/keto reductase n=1 Tax=Amnibacterium sp. TaxID=1872496 RepID=UPI002620A854|nr:aldo/keto reductase [Amnibacterium sp.]MCU1473202.1 2,5-diketo-D-gluconic acid reductase [Amnibacterium sp.]